MLVLLEKAIKDGTKIFAVSMNTFAFLFSVVSFLVNSVAYIRINASFAKNILDEPIQIFNCIK